MNRRLTFLMGWRREVRRAKGAKIGEDWRRRRSWQGITVGVGKGPVSLRWLLLHMIAETAQHAGHLDLLRDAIDLAAV